MKNQQTYIDPLDNFKLESARDNTGHKPTPQEYVELIKTKYMGVPLSKRY